MTPKIVPSLGIPPLVHGPLVPPESIYTVLQTACRLVQLVLHRYGCDQHTHVSPTKTLRIISDFLRRPSRSIECNFCVYSCAVVVRFRLTSRSSLGNSGISENRDTSLWNCVSNCGLRILLRRIDCRNVLSTSLDLADA